jgi:hypothetical protein
MIGPMDPMTMEKKIAGFSWAAQVMYLTGVRQKWGETMMVVWYRIYLLEDGARCGDVVVDWVWWRGFV